MGCPCMLKHCWGMNDEDDDDEEDDDDMVLKVWKKSRSVYLCI